MSKSIFSGNNKFNNLSKEERFWQKVEKKSDTSCWNWIGAINSGGYGSFNVNGKIISSQRVAWELTFGEIPDNFYVLHKCDNPSCVNPKHLFLGTHLDNARDKVSKNRQARGSSWGKELKYPFELVVRVRNIYETENISMREISRRFNITYSHLNAILHRRVRNVD